MIVSYKIYMCNPLEYLKGWSTMKNDNIIKYRDEFISVGLKIGYICRQRGMTQEQLAERAGISSGFLSQIEAPSMAVGISLATLFSIAEALNVSPHKLLEFDI